MMWPFIEYPSPTTPAESAAVGIALAMDIMIWLVAVGVLVALVGEAVALIWRRK